MLETAFILIVNTFAMILYQSLNCSYFSVSLNRTNHRLKVALLLYTYTLIKILLLGYVFTIATPKSRDLACDFGVRL